MPPPTTAVLFSASDPAAPPGQQLADPQSDGAQPAQKMTFVIPLAVPPSGANGGLAGAVKPDGTTITQDPDGTIHAPGGGGTGGGGGQTGASFAPVVPQGAKDGSNTQYTLPAPVLANTGYFYVRNGVMQRQLGSNAEYSVQGTALTTKYPLLSDDWHEFYYTPGTPNSESGGGGSVTPATIKGSSAITTGSGGATSITINFPAGSQAGDLALLYSGNSGANGSIPSGWTSLATGGSGSVSWANFVASKILTSGDIATGSVTVDIHGPLFAPNSYGIAEMVVFAGPSSGIRETDSSGISIANPCAVSTTSAVQNGDIGVFFGGAPLPTGGATMTVSSGAVQQSPNTADAMGILAVGTMPGGVSTITFTLTGSSSGQAYFVVIVQP